MKCVVCQAGAPTLTDAEPATFLPQVPQWKVVEREGAKRLERVFTLTASQLSCSHSARCCFTNLSSVNQG